MSNMYDQFHQILEAAIFAAGEPVSVDKLAQLFAADVRPSNKEIRAALKEIELFYHTRGVSLVEVSSGYRFQAKKDYAAWLQRLWEKKPVRYSRALLETLALIAYRQPTTRGEIEEVRGVAVSSNIMKILQERGWVKIIGHKDIPGKPALYATTKLFLDYFNLKSISELPPLEELSDLEALEKKLGEQMELGVESESQEEITENEIKESIPSESTEYLAEDVDVETKIISHSDESANGLVNRDE